MKGCDHDFKAFKDKEVERKVFAPQNSNTTYYKVRCVKCGLSLDKLRKQKIEDSKKED